MDRYKQVIHTATINTNCPECYSTDGLEFSFTQEVAENRLFFKASKEVENQLHCETCGQDIYPVNWTEDIERVFDYHSKLAKPMGSGFKLKPLAYILILIDVAILAFLIYYFSNN